ncbi:hypothetical protein [Desulfosporosinus sp. SB140]|uniref:hypothetical protein n=1 Tax=Desulfosporosinus paludis TaxID=3115649 RepID=UPI00388F79C1
MRKINDRIYLGIASGAIGFIAQNLIDILSSKMKISERTYWTTAAGVWVSSRRESEKWSGQLLGALMNLGLSMVGGVSIVAILSKYGRDKLAPKGIFFGVTFGSMITGLLSGFASNKVKPKTAKSNLSYILANAVFGLTSTLAAAKLGDDSLFDVIPQNNYLKPTNQTTEQRTKDVEINNVQPIYSDISSDLGETPMM